MPPDSFSSALGQLDPASRALLDLSLRRGMRSEEIADMLGAEPWNVALSRDEALRRVATSVGMTGDEQLDEVRARLAELPAEEWLQPSNGNGDAPAVEAEDPTAGPEGAAGPTAAEPPEADEPGATAAEPITAAPPDGADPTGSGAPEAAAATGTEPRERGTAPSGPATPESCNERQRNLRLPILLALLAVTIVVAVVLAVTSGSSDDGQQASSPPAEPRQPRQPGSPDEPPAQQQPARPPATEITAIAGSGATGTAGLTADGDRLTLRITGLPGPSAGDRYTVWLYDSLLDARRIGSATKGSFKIDAKLPSTWQRYRFVDVSREPADGNPNHSGQSVARVRTSALKQR